MLLSGILVIKLANCLFYYNTIILLDLLTTGFIISSNNKLQIYLLFIWSRRVVVETIFRKVKNLYVAKWSNNHPYRNHYDSKSGLCIGRASMFSLSNFEPSNTLPLRFLPRVKGLRSFRVFLLHDLVSILKPSSPPPPRPNI
jgi:hypothetical protein